MGWACRRGSLGACSSKCFRLSRESGRFVRGLDSLWLLKNYLVYSFSSHLCEVYVKELIFGLYTCVFINTDSSGGRLLFSFFLSFFFLGWWVDFRFTFIRIIFLFLLQYSFVLNIFLT
ncbi:hypothetical protein ACOSQ2_017977 [Xanthoceras sorbifolium]